MRKISAVLLLLLPVCLLLTGCAAAPRERERSFFAMDTYMTLRLYGGDETTVVRGYFLLDELDGGYRVSEFVIESE